MYLGTVSNDRNNNINIIKFLASILVVYSHSFDLSGNKMLEPFRLIRAKTTLGGIAVSIFFVISGFLVVQSLENSKSIEKYIFSKWKRLIPGLFFASIFIVLILGTFYTDKKLLEFIKDKEVLKFIFENISLIKTKYIIGDIFRNNIYPSALNGAWWTLPWQFCCYVILILLTAFDYKNSKISLGIFLVLLGIGIYKPWRISIVLIIYLYFLFMYFLKGFDKNYKINIYRNKKYFLFIQLSSMFLYLLTNNLGIKVISMFLAGSLFYIYRNSITLSKSRLIISVLILLLSLSNKYFLTISEVLFGSYIILYLSYGVRIKISKFGKKGDLSYGIYLYHFFIQQLIVSEFKNEILPLKLFILSFVFSYLLSLLSWNILEKKLLNYKLKPFFSKRVSIN